MAREFGKASGKQVKVWGFLSPRGEMTFPSHRDPAHVVALQLDGQKRWRLDGPPPAVPWDSLADVEPSGESFKLSLEPGDVLYLPHGFAHCAVAESACSYHISFALEGMSAGEVRTSVVKGIYDNLDRSDGTEVSPANLPGILDDVCQSLGMMVEQLSALAKRNPDQIDLQEIAKIFDNLRD
jgi:ribosomal protein L16 Arg81 hydroxylase